MRGEFWSTLGRYERAVFGLQAAWRQRFVIGSKSSIGYDIHLAMMRMPYPLLSSYVDIGGLNAFPGYSAGSLKRDVAQIGALYHYAIGEFLGFDSFLQTTAKLIVTDRYDPYLVPPSSYPLTPGSLPLFDFDFGLSMGMGLQTPLGMWSYGSEQVSSVRSHWL